jgi:hypothetical protein
MKGLSCAARWRAQRHKDVPRHRATLLMCLSVLVVIALGVPAAASAEWEASKLEFEAPGESWGASRLNAASCGYVCVAAGFAETALHHDSPLIERGLRPGSTHEFPPTPTGATGGGVLQGVWCEGQNDTCNAVGYYLNSSGERVAFSDARHLGGPWTAVEVTTGTGAELNAVSCTGAATLCSAVGTQASKLLILHGGYLGWGRSTPATPKEVKSFGKRFGVSCQGTEECFMDGSYENTAGKTVAFAEFTWGTKWTLLTVPTPAGATLTRANAVSCRGSGCTMVGSYVNSGGLSRTLAWKVKIAEKPELTLELPKNAEGAANNLTGVSCPRATECEAVGELHGTELEPAGNAEIWNGTTWAFQKTKANAASDLLQGVGCGGATTYCASAGFKNEVFGERAYAEYR